MKWLVVLLLGVLLPAALVAGPMPARAAQPIAPAVVRAATHVQAAMPTRVVANCTHLAVKPRRVVVTCADGGIYVVFRHYRAWTRTLALGRGVYWFNDCKPSCAGGTFHHFRAFLRLGAVVMTARGPVFSRLQVRYLRGGVLHRVGYRLPTRPFG